MLQLWDCRAHHKTVSKNERTGPTSKKELDPEQWETLWQELNETPPQNNVNTEPPLEGFLSAQQWLRHHWVRSWRNMDLEIWRSICITHVWRTILTPYLHVMPVDYWRLLVTCPLYPWAPITLFPPNQRRWVKRPKLRKICKKSQRRPKDLRKRGTTDRGDSRAWRLLETLNTG